MCAREKRTRGEGAEEEEIAVEEKENEERRGRRKKGESFSLDKYTKEIYRAENIQVIRKKQCK